MLRRTPKSGTQAAIDDARALLKPHPVTLHHIPRWFASRLRPYRSRGVTSSSGVLDAMLRKTRGAWLDHWGSSISFDGRPAFVAEPYGFSAETARALDELTKETGLEWRVESNSWWYPGHTVRIEITEPRASTAKTA